MDAGWVCCGGAVCWDIFARDTTDDEMTMVARGSYQGYRQYNHDEHFGVVFAPMWAW